MRRTVGTFSMALVALALAAAPAQAGLLGDLGSTLKDTTAGLAPTLDDAVGEQPNPLPAEGLDPLTPLDDLLEGTIGLPAAAQQLVCPPLEQVEELLGGGAGAATSSLCLELRFLTRYKRPDDTVVERLHDALVGVPTQLDVDDDAASDLTATVTLTGVATAGLTVNQVAAQTEPLPVSVEAILSDEGGETIGVDNIAFGYDATADRAPEGFVIDTPLASLLARDFDFTVTQTGRGDRVALTGAVFGGGDPLVREDPTSVRLDYLASPDTARIQANLSDGVRATLGQNRRGVAELSGAVTEGGSTDRFAARIDELPTSTTLTVNDSGDGVTVGYAAAETVDSIVAEIETATALIGDARLVRATFEDVPTAFDLTAAPGGDGFTLDASGSPIGTITLQAAATAAQLPDAPGGAGEGGALYDDVGGTRIAARVFGLDRLAVGLAPISLEATLAAGSPFVLDARLAQPGGAPPLEIDGVLRDLPSDFSLGVAETPAGEGGGTRVQYTGSAPMDLVDLQATGLDLVDGASDLRAIVEGVPTQLTLTLPESGPLAKLQAAPGESVRQVRLKAGPAVGVPASGLASVNGPVNPAVDDLIQYRDLATANGFGVAVRLTGLRSLSAALDPIAIELGQDTAINKQIDIDAQLRETAGGPVTTIDNGGEPFAISKPSARTTIGVQTGSGPTRISYDGDPAAAPGATTLARLNLRALNLGGVPRLDASVQNLPRSADICFDSGDGCLRAGDPGPARPRGGSNNYRPVVSLDAVTSHSSGFVRLDGEVQLGVGEDPITIDDVRFRNLAFDLTQGNAQSILGVNIPRVAAYIDTDNQPFRIGDITYDAIEAFGIGRTPPAATAQNRFLWVKGFCASANPFNSCFPVDIDQTTSGSLHCDSRSILRVFGINMLDIPVFGQLVRLCSSGVG